METVGKKLDSVIDEINKVNVLTDRVKKRREEYLKAKPHLCAERSRAATESWKETEADPVDIRRAKLFKKVMEKNPVALQIHTLNFLVAHRSADAS